MPLSERGSSRLQHDVRGGAAEAKAAYASDGTAAGLATLVAVTAIYPVVLLTLGTLAGRRHYFWHVGTHRICGAWPRRKRVIIRASLNRSFGGQPAGGFPLCFPIGKCPNFKIPPPPADFALYSL